MNILDDVERSVFVLPIAPERLSFPTKALDIFFAGQGDYLMKSLASKFGHGGMQLTDLAMDNIARNGAIRPLGIVVKTDGLWEVKDDRHE